MIISLSLTYSLSPLLSLCFSLGVLCSHSCIYRTRVHSSFVLLCFARSFFPCLRVLLGSPYLCLSVCLSVCPPTHPGYDHKSSSTSSSCASLYFRPVLPFGTYHFRYLSSSAVVGAVSSAIHVTRTTPLPSMLPAQARNPSAPAVQVIIGTFNVLAPAWTYPPYYPSSCNGPSTLDPTVRIPKNIVQMQAMTYNGDYPDFIILTEAEIDPNAQFASALSSFGPSGYAYFASYHDDPYWECWFTHPLPLFRPNGIAIAVSKAKYDTANCKFGDIVTSGDGNHAPYLTCPHRATGLVMRVLGAHLDTDSTKRWRSEVTAIANIMGPAHSASGYVDIVAGDFNAAPAGNLLATELVGNRGFTNVLAAAGVHTGTVTSGGVIDHVYVRGPGVVTGGAGSAVLLVTNKMCTALNTGGSDHLPLRAVVSV